MEVDSGTSVHKVHFQETLDTFGHDSGIVVQPLNDVLINVHLGFVQVNHRYEVRFQFDSPAHLGSLSVRTQDPPNLNLRVLELKPVISTGPRYEVVLEFLAYKEKLLREQLLLQSCNNPLLTLTLVLNARVLGKGKGTPFLKTGIHCIGIEMEEESENDWQGFD
uniref:Adipose-secreted signaling protein n=1 Tax=Amblyomma triste TaxID=251400 RepID=A0A023GEQ1_AMBTT